DLQISRVGKGRAKNPEFEVRFFLKNTGKRQGSEVAQLYIGQISPGVPRPVRELKGFTKVSLNPGESRSVSFRLDPSSFSYYDVKSQGWKYDPGKYDLFVGASYEDTRLRKELKID
ncbi:MAG: fibronectin type III-like domain-contianing protein, partial [Bdellovibrionales bacterium]|nr:fibronectin type III-like domain-contianing protein [Bdellovibrionales bacterium]